MQNHQDAEEIAPVCANKHVFRLVQAVLPAVETAVTLVTKTVQMAALEAAEAVLEAAVETAHIPVEVDALPRQEYERGKIKGMFKRMRNIMLNIVQNDLFEHMHKSM